MKIKRILCALLVVFTLVAAFPMAAFAQTASTAINASAAAKLSKKTATVVIGKKLKLKVKSNKGKVRWSSSKKSVATVNSKGVVTAKKTGTATITARLANGKKLKCKVKVVTPVTGSVVFKADGSYTVSFKNNTKKTVTCVEFTEKDYDKKGVCVDNYTFPLDFMLENGSPMLLAPGKTTRMSGSDSYYSNLSKVVITVNRVVYSDGTSWTAKGYTPLPEAVG